MTVGLVDLDLGAGHLFEFADNRTLGADDLADLVLRDLDRLDPWRPFVHLAPWLGNDLSHGVEDEQSGFTSLAQ